MEEVRLTPSTFAMRPDAAAVGRLMIRYWPTVLIIAAKLKDQRPRFVDRGDLAGYGAIGLRGAILKFDAGRGVKFSTYASHRIAGAMRDGMRSEKWTPGRAKQNGESRTIVSINDVRQRDQGQSVTPASCLACPAAGRRERLMLSRDVMRRLNVGMSRSERLILDLRYAEGMTMKEIGRVLGLAESQAAKKHRDLLDRLKEKLAEKPT